MPRDANRDSLYLADIVEASQTVSRWLTAHGHGRHDDEILQNAVLRQLMVFGEAAACLSREVAEVNLPVLGDRAHALLREEFPSVAALDRQRHEG